MKEFINKIKQNAEIQINNERYTIKTKTWYSIEEDSSASYIKCEMSNNKVLVIIPDEELIYVGKVIANMQFERISEDELLYESRKYKRTGGGHQYITKIEFGNKEEVEGKCIFEDFESGEYVISLGVLPEKGNERADVFSEVIKIDDISIIE